MLKWNVKHIILWPSHENTCAHHKLKNKLCGNEHSSIFLSITKWKNPHTHEQISQTQGKHMEEYCPTIWMKWPLKHATASMSHKSRMVSFKKIGISFFRNMKPGQICRHRNPCGEEDRTSRKLIDLKVKPFLNVIETLTAYIKSVNVVVFELYI